MLDVLEGLECREIASGLEWSCESGQRCLIIELKTSRTRFMDAAGSSELLGLFPTSILAASLQFKKLWMVEAIFETTLNYGSMFASLHDRVDHPMLSWMSMRQRGQAKGQQSCRKLVSFDHVVARCDV